MKFWHRSQRTANLSGWILRRSAIAAFSVSMLLPSFAADITAYTEDWAPYNYAEGAAVKGISTDILREACALARRLCEIHLVPWARAYKMASSTPNALAFTMARTPKREKEFLWIGPITQRTTWVYIRSDKASSFPNLKRLANARVGVVRYEASERDLISAGVPDSAFVHASSNAELLKMSARDMIDAMVDTEVGMAWNLRTAGLKPSAFVRAMKLSDEGAYYFAMNSDSDSALVHDLQVAIATLKRTGKSKAIVNQYLDGAK